MLSCMVMMDNVFLILVYKQYTFCPQGGRHSAHMPYGSFLQCKSFLSLAGYQQVTMNTFESNLDAFWLTASLCFGSANTQ